MLWINGRWTSFSCSWDPTHQLRPISICCSARPEHSATQKPEMFFGDILSRTLSWRHCTITLFQVLPKHTLQNQHKCFLRQDIAVCVRGPTALYNGHYIPVCGLSQRVLAAG